MAARTSIGAMRRLTARLAWLAVLLVPQVAAAAGRPWVLTVSLADLAQPLYDLKLETQVEKDLSISAKAGVASYPTAHLDSLTLLVLACQADLYFRGNFARGLQLALDGEYTRSWITAAGIDGAGDRLRVALLLGAKWTGRKGFVAEAQVGAGVSLSEVRSVGEAARSDTNTVLGPRGDFRIGYQF